ncbi:hypothetical protein QTP88_015021 [Uroleucon formosanum]
MCDVYKTIALENVLGWVSFGHFITARTCVSSRFSVISDKNTETFFSYILLRSKGTSLSLIILTAHKTAKGKKKKYGGNAKITLPEGLFFEFQTCADRSVAISLMVTIAVCTGTNVRGHHQTLVVNDQ